RHASATILLNGPDQRQSSYSERPLNGSNADSSQHSIAQQIPSGSRPLAGECHPLGRNMGHRVCK
ncbi:hypothetical protein BaRGS_00021889, partial [Batillaria attramentaria]